MRKWLDISFIVCFSGTVFLFLFSPALLFHDRELRLAAAILSPPILFLCGILIPCRIACGNRFFRELGLTRPSKRDLLPMLSAIPVFLFFALCTAVIRMVGIPVAPQALAGYAANCSGWSFLLIVFSAGILAPAAEELAYRRVMFDFFREKLPFGEVPAYLITSFLFAVSHGIIWQSVLLFFFGLLLQWYQRTGSTTRAILTHSLLNCCSLFALYLIRSGVIPS